MQSKGWSVRHRLLLLALAVALPFILLSAGIVWQLASNERVTRREAILFSTRTLMNAVDATLGKQIAVAKSLIGAASLERNDLANFEEEAKRANSELSGGWLVLSDQSGRQLMNLGPGTRTQISHRPEAAMVYQRRALATGQVQISGVFVDPLTGSPVVTVEVPVKRQNGPPLELSVVMRPDLFLALFEQWNLPEGWLAGLVDRDGNFIARSRSHAETVGKPASESFRRVAHNAAEGWHDIVALEGNTVANAHVTSPLSGWVMGLAADKTLFEAPIRNTILIAAVAGTATTLLSLLLAMWSARRIAKPIEQIEQGTHALVLRRAITFTDTGLPEADRTLNALAETAQVLERHDKERDEREAHVRLIMRELSHRSKNLLAIVLAIARQTARHTTTFHEFETRFNSRIQALADAHDLLVEQQWGGAYISDLVNAQLAAFGMEKVTCAGERIMLRAEAVQNVALALHELATNASKYGALSVPTGKVEIVWAREASEFGEQNLRFTWRESGGPAVAAPAKKGFGCFVLERVTLNALGEGQLDFNPAGLVWTCIIKPEHLVEPGSAAAAAAETVAALRPRRRGVS